MAEFSSTSPFAADAIGRLIGVAVMAVALVAFAAGLAMGSHPQPSQLPAGFSVQHADGVTYVCSQHPVYCTGNAPAWSQRPQK